MSLLAGTAASACAAVLIVAGLLKVRERVDFGNQIMSYDLVPQVAARLLGQILPFLEILGGLALLVAPTAGYVCAVMFMAFAVAVTLNLARGRRDFQCGCFGPTGHRRIGFGHVVLNVALASSAFVVAVEAKGRPSLLAFQIGSSLVLLGFLASKVGDPTLYARKESVN